MNTITINRKMIIRIQIIALLFLGLLPAVDRNGTTAANFLEIDVGSRGTSMGGAFVSVTNDLSSIFWNPAGLTGVRNQEVMFIYQPWILDINHVFTGAAVNVPSMGTFAAGLTYMSYGDEPVTTVANPEGTGELYAASEYAIGISFSRKIVNWFSFGATGKFVSSNIWHMNATAAAVDLGVIITTDFFVPNEDRQKGLKIGMSISNYGSRMRYDGIDLLNPIDITDDNGNFENVPGLFRTEQWELPLIFRIGVSMQPIATHNQDLIIALDALHPNNNSESINLGAEYEFRQNGVTSYFLRGGYKGKYMVDSEYGPTFGAGIKMKITHYTSIKVDYCYKTMGRLGNHQSYTIGFEL